MIADSMGKAPSMESASSDPCLFSSMSPVAWCCSELSGAALLVVMIVLNYLIGGSDASAELSCLR